VSVVIQFCTRDINGAQYIASRSFRVAGLGKNAGTPRRVTGYEPPTLKIMVLRYAHHAILRPRGLPVSP
jgi:hypothetical protein